MANSSQNQVNLLKLNILSSASHIMWILSRVKIGLPIPGYCHLYTNFYSLCYTNAKWSKCHSEHSQLTLLWGRHMEHGTGWSRTQYACFVRVVFFCPRSEVWVCPRALQTSLPTCQRGKEVFYCKTCNWGNGDWFSGLQIATSHFIPRHFNMKKDTICASEWIC